MNYPDLNSILLSHNHKYSVSVVLKWIITHMFLCNYSQFDKHRKPKSTFFTELNPAPFLTHRGANKHDGFHLKQHLSKETFNVSLMWNSSCFSSSFWSFWQESAAELSGPGWLKPVQCLFFTYYFEVGSRQESYTYGCPSPTESISVSEGKVMGLWVGGVWGKANSEGLNTQSKHYPMFELHTLSPTVLPHARALPSQSYSC